MRSSHVVDIRALHGARASTSYLCGLRARPGRNLHGPGPGQGPGPDPGPGPGIVRRFF